MKPVSEITVVVSDYGTFFALAEMFAETCKKVYLHCPNEAEYRDVRNEIGTGIKGVEYLRDYMEPEVFKEIDLFVFPDIGHGGIQRYLRSVGKAVWGSMGASDIELYRTAFLEILKKLGLTVPKYVTIKGLTALEDYLKTVTNKWVKINEWRGNMETRKHVDYIHSRQWLDELAVESGGKRDELVFVVQDPIKSDAEIGYDGLSVDGKFPKQSFQGYEKKNELYLGSLLSSEKLPDVIKEVNGQFSKVLAQYEYRNFFATEIRVKDGKGFFIDPTMRMAGQTQEHLLETCINLAEVMWQGANGILLEPDYSWKYAAEATLHYNGVDSDSQRVVKNPKSRWFKWYHYYVRGDYIWFPPGKNDEIGVAIGVGDSIEDAIDHLKQNLEELKGEPLTANTEGFADLLKSIQEAEKQGMEFSTEPIPDPKSVL